MKCNCKSAGSRSTALAFINDIACVSKKSRRVRKIPLLHLLRRSIAPKCTRMPWNGDERVRSERDKTPLLHLLAISLAFSKFGRRVRKTPHLHLLRMSLFHLLCTGLYWAGASPPDSARKPGSPRNSNLDLIGNQPLTLSGET